MEEPKVVDEKVAVTESLCAAAIEMLTRNDKETVLYSISDEFNYMTIEKAKFKFGGNHALTVILETQKEGVGARIF